MDGREKELLPFIEKRQNTNRKEKAQVREIKNIEKRKKPILITHMRNDVRDMEASRKGFFNIFAFSTKIYTQAVREVWTS